MKSRISVVCVLAGIALSAGSVLASGVFIGTVTLADSYGNTGGGEFQATESGFSFIPRATGTAFQNHAAGPGLFETFCVEENETISFGTTYNAYLNTMTQSSSPAYNGGAHGGSSDPLDAMTAYLYTNFLNHSLTSGYDYSNATNRATDADALQTAIWHIEQEDNGGALTGLAQTYWTEANNAVNVNHTWTVGIGNVRILNLFDSGGADHQDQLVMIPLPTTAGLGALGLVGVGLRRRRKS